MAQFEEQPKQAQENQTPPPPTEDPKTTEAMAVLMELAKALRVIAA